VGANKKNKTIMTFECEPCAMVKSFIDFRRQRQISGQMWTYITTLKQGYELRLQSKYFGKVQADILNDILYMRSLNPPILKPQMFVTSPSGNSAGLAQLSWSALSQFSSKQ